MRERLACTPHDVKSAFSALGLRQALRIAARVLLALTALLVPARPRAEGAVWIDRLHPEAFRTPSWIDVSLPSSQVSLHGLRVLTANRAWTLQICEAPPDLSTCTTVVAAEGTGAGWRGDFRNSLWSFSYQDRQAGRKLHLRVTPVGGDWMIFRIQTEARP